MMLKDKILEAPKRPGVYLLKDKRGKIAYVGKARNLRDRLRSYTTTKEDPRIAALISRATDLDYIVTNSEVEALILEENLIKINKPKYNVRLKDDKKFPYLKITAQEKYPRIFPTRNLRPDGSILFGPFTSAKALRKAIKGVKRIFQIRTCNKKLPCPIPLRPCLNLPMNRCLGPCRGTVPEELYRERVDNVIAFLSGKSDKISGELEKKMFEASSNEDFEKAAIIRDQLMALREIMRNQPAVFKDKLARDIFGLARTETLAFATRFKVREGKLSGREEYPLTLTRGTKDSEILESLLRSIYTHTFDLPDEIVLPVELNEEAVEPLIQWYKEKRDKTVKIYQPKRGEKIRLLNLANRNADVGLAENVPVPKIHQANLDLQHFLGLNKPPRVIEGVDISNISGTSATGSIVVFHDYYPYKPDYRLFKIKTVAGPNDYAMMEEVLSRRAKRQIKENKPLADLVLIDGGKGQLSTAIRAYQQTISGQGSSVQMPAMLAFAKRTDTLYFEDGREISIPATSSALKLLKRIRDEAHRFAITYHKKLRGKTLVASELDGLSGLGEKRKIALIRYFGSLEKLKLATVEEIAKVKLIGKSFADKIYEYLHN
jgi:excinuclease ABC subunit C